MVQKDIGYRSYPQHVQTAFTVSELNYIAQHLNELSVVLFPFIDMLRYHILQRFLFYVKRYCVLNAMADGHFVKRSCYVIRRSKAVRLFDIRLSAFGGQHDYRQRIYPLIAVYSRQNLYAVHFRHKDIQKHQRYFGNPAGKYSNSFYSGCSFDYIIGW